MEGISDVATYKFAKNRITREDVFTITGDQKVKKVRLVFLTYSKQPKTEGAFVKFGQGVISGMCADGYEGCVVHEATKDGSFDTPHGRLNTEVVWEREGLEQTNSLKLSWTIEYSS